MDVFLVFLNYFLWSSAFALGKSALSYCPPLFLIAVRMIIAGLLILGFVFVFKREQFKIKKGQLSTLFLLALMAVYLSNAFEMWGLQFLTAAKACFIYSLTPFISALFSYFQFKEQITLRKMVGLFIGFVGFIPIFMHHTGSEQMLGGFFIFSWAEIALIIGTITAVYGWILLRKLGKEEKMSPLMANGCSMLMGGAMALAHSGLVETWSPTPVTNWTAFLQGVAAIILISNLICYNFYGWLLKRFTATFLSFAGLISPLFAAFYGWLLHGETVPPIFFFSLAILLSGLWLIYYEELRLGYIEKKKLTPKPA